MWKTPVWLWLATEGHKEWAGASTTESKQTGEKVRGRLAGFKHSPLTAGKGIHKHGLTWKCSSELHSWMWEELQRSPPYTIKGSSPIQPSLCYFCGLPHNPRTESNPLIWNNKHCQVTCCLMVLACDVGLWLLAGFWEVRFVGDLWFSIMFF